jgi:hypothetical protein
VRAALLLVIAACVEPAHGYDANTHVIAFEWPARGVPQLDLLFVVDDSSGMAPYRDRVLDASRTFADALAHYGAGKPDVHAGVTTRGDVTFVSDLHNNDGSRNTSFSGTLADALATLVDVGTAGTAPNQPLAAIDVARTAPGFRRANARLMVVTISASDDVSLDSVAAYTARLGDAVTAGIYPAGSPRLDAFHDRFVDDINAVAYTHVFEPLNIIVDYGATCIDEPASPYDCAISMLEGDRETVLPACSHTPEGPCWDIVDDPLWCPGQRTINVRGYARIYRPHLFGQCVSR